MSSGITSGSSRRRMITAFFDSRTDAEEAVRRLHGAGVSRDSIQFVPGYERNTDQTASGDTNSLGDASVGFWDSLRDLFLPDEDRATYAEGLRRGGYLVSVSASDAEYERVFDILDDEGTIDIDERADSWRSEGWTGRSTDARAGSAAHLPSGISGTTSAGRTGSGTTSQGAFSERVSGREGEEVIPVAEERLNVGKRDVSHGRVRVRSYVVETPVNEQVNLRDETVRVERRPVDRATTGNENLFKERVIEAEERAEEAVVAKQARVKEEVTLRKEGTARTETVSDKVRRTEVEVEDERGNKTGSSQRNIR